jgi:hypothetical protein
VMLHHVFLQHVAALGRTGTVPAGKKYRKAVGTVPAGVIVPALEFISNSQKTAYRYRYQSFMHQSLLS